MEYLFQLTQIEIIIEMNEMYNSSNSHTLVALNCDYCCSNCQSDKDDNLLADS